MPHVLRQPALPPRRSDALRPFGQGDVLLRASACAYRRCLARPCPRAPCIRRRSPPLPASRRRSSVAAEAVPTSFEFTSETAHRMTQSPTACRRTSVAARPCQRGSRLAVPLNRYPPRRCPKRFLPFAGRAAGAGSSRRRSTPQGTVRRRSIAPGIMTKRGAPGCDAGHSGGRSEMLHLTRDRRFPPPPNRRPPPAGRAGPGRARLAAPRIRRRGVRSAPA